MPGFFVSNTKSNVELVDRYPERCIVEKLDSGKAQRQTLNKFLLDKAFHESDRYIIVNEGYLLNKTQLFEEFGAKTVTELVEKMYLECGETFFSAFQGCFSGALYIKEDEKWLVYSNQVGDAPVFYINRNGDFAAGSEINYILSYCKEKGVTLSFNEACAYQMLTYGFIATDETYANEIKRIGGGDYLIFQNGKIEVKTYHRFEKHKERFESKTEEQIIEELDKGFRNAVFLEWNKDKEYGLKHLADLSGGLDSRMNMWVAHVLEERNMTLLTYSKKGYLDEKIARAIAKYWGDELLFTSLDDISYMCDIEENTNLLAGLSLYYGITGGKRFLESLDLSEYGIEHTGMIGDVTIGSFYSELSDAENKLPTGMYSEKLRNRVLEHTKNISEAYFDHEIFLMYSRGFHGACNTHLIRRNFTEVASPFFNVEFMQLCYDIPVSLRIDHYIYKKWILKKYPHAAKFKWEKTGAKITESKLIKKLKRYFIRAPKKLWRIITRTKYLKTGMNPVDYWLAKNAVVREYMNAYESSAYAFLPKGVSSQLIEDMKFLYNKGTVAEKSMVLTVLASAKLYFGEGLHATGDKQN